jgi:hypothetical protein
MRRSRHSQFTELLLWVDLGPVAELAGRPKRSTRNEVLFLKLRMPENVLSGRAKLTEEC